MVHFTDVHLTDFTYVYPAAQGRCKNISSVYLFSGIELISFTRLSIPKLVIRYPYGINWFI